MNGVNYPHIAPLLHEHLTFNMFKKYFLHVTGEQNRFRLKYRRSHDRHANPIPGEAVFVLRRGPSFWFRKISCGFKHSPWAVDGNTLSRIFHILRLLNGMLYMWHKEGVTKRTRTWNLSSRSQTAWRRFEIKTFFALLTLCKWNPPVTSGSPLITASKNLTKYICLMGTLYSILISLSSFGSNEVCLAEGIC